MPRFAWSVLVLLSTALFSSPAVAEVSTRECIRLGSTMPPGPAYVIPALTQVTLLTMGFALNDASNAIFGAQIFFPDAAAQTLGNGARFDILIDGVTTGRLTTPIQYYTRTPYFTQGIVSLRAFYQDLAATTTTDHTLTLVVNNTSTNAFVVNGAYANALFVDAAELAAGLYKNTTQTVGSTTYTSIGQITIPAITNRHFFVSSYIRASSPNTMKFRYLVNGVVTEKKEVNFLNADNGTTVDWLIQNAVAGQTVILQALTGSGTGSVTVVEMAGQAMQTYSVLGYTQDDTYSSSAAGLTWINYGAAPGTLPPATTLPIGGLSLSGPASIYGGQAGCMWGTTDTSLSISPANAEAQLSLQLLWGPTPPYMQFGGTDFGEAAYSPDATFSSYHQQSDFGCGGSLFSGNNYILQQGVINLCTTAPVPTWTNTHQRLQMVVLPEPCTPSGPGNCSEVYPGGNCGPTPPKDATCCDLDNHTCTTQTRMGWLSGTPCFQVTCPHQCTLNLTSTTMSRASYCS
jgi:hypothetical protein